MLPTAIAAARAAGELLRERFGRTLRVDEELHHDVKLEVDKLAEEVIVRTVTRAFPDHAVLGEERGAAGTSSHRWVIDPLDGTINYFHGIPHFAVSVALEVDGEPRVGVIYDPMRDELFACERGRGATLNGRPVRVNAVSDPRQAIFACGFTKEEEAIRAALVAFSDLVLRVRKIRSMGSAALDLAYVAAGRFAAYYEPSIYHWDFAAGRALVLEAGGRVDAAPASAKTWRVYASNGRIHETLRPA